MPQHIEEILKFVLQKTNSNVYIKGSPGSGRTWILHALGDRFQEVGFCCIFLNGQPTTEKEFFYPLKRFIEAKERTQNKGIAALKESVGEIPYVGKAIKSLLSDYDFKSHKSRTAIQELVPFRNNLDFSLHLIGLQHDSENIIILCDDIDEFDSETIQYLSLLRDGFLQIGKEINLSFISTGKAPNSGLASFDFKNENQIELEDLSITQVGNILQFWSGKKISSETLNLIHSCAGNHLQLLKISANYLREADSVNLKSSGSFLETIIAFRLKTLTDRYQQLINIFQAISQSGTGTNSYEIICLLDNEKDVMDNLRFALDIDFLTLSDNYFHFTHPVIGKYISSVATHRKSDFYEKLSGCLKKLTPANYERRALVEKLANRQDQADILFALAAIANMRQGYFAQSQTLFKQISVTGFGRDILDGLHQFEVCYELSLGGNIDETLFQVDQISNALPMQLIAEKSYLKADSLAKRISDSPKSEALKLIAEWEDIKSEEPEIWYRLIQLKIILAAEIGLVDTASRAELEIIKYFSARLSFDSNARSVLERMNIFSDIIYTPEIAHKKMLQTERWMSLQFENKNYHKILDIYLSRTNLSSNSIVVDDLSKAIESAKGAIELIDQFPEIRFPCPEAAYNNLYLAMLMASPNSPLRLRNKFRELYEKATIEENKMLIDINYAGVLLMNNEMEQALRVLDGCNYIPSVDNDNSYYSYYYLVDYAVILFLLGHPKTEVDEIMARLESIVENVSFISKRFYIEHFRLLRLALAQPGIKNYFELNQFAESTKPIFLSSVWKRFKTIYLFTDIQIWNIS